MDDKDRGERKRIVGLVLSAKMAKTIVVSIVRLEKHPKYGKYVRRHTKFYAHDEAREACEGDTVEIQETRPLSRLKRWRLLRVLERRATSAIAPGRVSPRYFAFLRADLVESPPRLKPGATPKDRALWRAELLALRISMLEGGVLSRLEERGATIESDEEGVSGASAALLEEEETIEAEDEGGIRGTRPGHSERRRCIVRPLVALNMLVVEGNDWLLPALREDRDVAEVFAEKDLQGLSFTVPTPGLGSVRPEMPHGSDWFLERDKIVGDAWKEGIEGTETWIGFADSGIEATHPEFLNRTVRFQDFDRTGKRLPTGPHDKHDHGSHVAGAAAGNTCGVARKAQIAMARVLDEGLRAPFARVIEGLQWLGTLRLPEGGQGVHVINLSFVTTSVTPDGVKRAAHNAVFQKVIATLEALDIPVIGALGNSGPGTHGSPGDYANVIGIGAVDRNDAWWPPSSRATITRDGTTLEKPDFCALGVAVYSAVRNGRRDYKSGSSMATGVTSGVAALLCAAGHGGGDLRSELAKRARCSGSGLRVIKY
jgi:ribosomal protein uS17